MFFSFLVHLVLLFSFPHVVCPFCEVSYYCIFFRGYYLIDNLLLCLVIGCYGIINYHITNLLCNILNTLLFLVLWLSLWFQMYSTLMRCPTIFLLTWYSFVFMFCLCFMVFPYFINASCFVVVMCFTYISFVLFFPYLLFFLLLS